jgi:ribonuclease BN (tRNA processing enzyme)
MATELVLLGTAAAPMPVAGRAGICSALVVDGHVYLIDCGRGSPSAYVDAGLDFTRLRAILLTHFHADHTGDLAGMLLYPWGVRVGDDGPLAPLHVYGPACPETPLPAGTAGYHRQTTINPRLPMPSATNLVQSILAGYAYHLNIMPLDARMPDAGALVRAFDIPVPASAVDSATPASAVDIVAPASAAGTTQMPFAVFDDELVRVTAVTVSHGHATPALAYRFDTADGSVVFSGDTTVNDDLIALAQGADVLVHCVADLDYLARHGTTTAELEHMAALHTDVSEVGDVAERAHVDELILTHYLPAEPDAIGDAQWAARAADGFGGITTAGKDGLRRVLGGPGV